VSKLSSNLPGLITSGNLLLRTDTMQPVVLRGVNRSGLEYTPPDSAGFLSAAQFSEDEVREIVTCWHANVIRIPLNQSWALNGTAAHSAEAYLSALDQVIAWAAALGAYTILDLQWLDAETIYGSVRQQGKDIENHVAPLPNSESIALWRTLADRYRDEPAVLFDLFNEPHDPLEDDPHLLHLVSRAGQLQEWDYSFITASDWVRWAELLIHEIRTIRPDGLILVSGVDWAFDLRRVRVSAPNIVYSVHIYPDRKPHLWSRALGNTNDVPVFVAEWGGSDHDLDFGRTLAAKMRDLQLGWTAWSWVDYPRLIEAPRAPLFTPTPFGQLVRDELCSVTAR
jgi:aryl-phospho-beta-D-glucosidase BglC (GH1 family)